MPLLGPPKGNATKLRGSNKPAPSKAVKDESANTCLLDIDSSIPLLRNAIC